MTNVNAKPIAYLGLGAMGIPMVENLLNAGLSVHVWNRSSDKARPVGDRGAVVADSLAEAVAPVQIAVSCLADDQAVEAICTEDMLKALGRGGIHLSMSTISPELARRLARLHAEHGVVYLGAPVLGRPDFVKLKKQSYLLSGEASSKAIALPILDLLGRQTFDLGDDPASAHAAKLCFNYLIAATISSLAEAYTLAEANGVAGTTLQDVLLKTVFGCPIYENYGRQILEDDCDEPLFTLRLGLKDVGLISDLARQSGVPMALGSAVHQAALEAVARGDGEKDWTALARTIRRRSGRS